MKKTRFLVSLLLSGILLTLFATCFDDNSSSKSSANVKISSKVLTEESKKGAPKFKNDKNSKTAYGTLAEMGKTLNSSRLKAIYSTFKDFDTERPDETMQQEVDGSNIWVSLYSCLKNLELAASYMGSDDNSNYKSKEFSKPVNISPTISLIEGGSALYSVGGTMVEKDKSSATWAGNIKGDIYQLLIATNMVENVDTKSSNITYFFLNSATGELVMDLNYLVKYGSTGPNANGLYAPRVWVNGNTLENSFKVLACNYGEGSSGAVKYFWSLRGAGKSKGTDEYMIFEFKALINKGDGWKEEYMMPDTPSTTPCGWYKIKADATSSDFSTIKWYSTYNELLAAAGDAKGYGSQVNNLTMFTTDDAGTKYVKALGDFKNDNKLSLPE